MISSGFQTGGMWLGCYSRSIPPIFSKRGHRQSGMLSCFFQGIFLSLRRRAAKARATRRRVERAGQADA